MKAIKWPAIIIGSLLLLAFSFLFQIYEVDYEVGYQPIYITDNDEITLSIFANTTSGNSTWLPFYAYVKDEGPYKFVIGVQDLLKKWDKLTLINVEYQDWDNNTSKLTFTNKNYDSASSTFTKEIDPNYGTEYFHFYTPGEIQLSSNINITVEFVLSNETERKHYKYKTLMELKTTKRSHWFTFISA